MGPPETRLITDGRRLEPTEAKCQWWMRYAHAQAAARAAAAAARQQAAAGRPTHDRPYRGQPRLWMIAIDQTPLIPMCQCHAAPLHAQGCWQPARVAGVRQAGDWTRRLGRRQSLAAGRYWASNSGWEEERCLAMDYSCGPGQTTGENTNGGRHACQTVPNFPSFSPVLSRR